MTRGTPPNSVTAVAHPSVDGLPSDLPASSYEVLRRSAARRGDAVALSFFLDMASHRRPRHWSYAALFDRVTRAANLFHTLGVEPRDVVALMLPNLPETHFAMWGAEAAGIAMPVNPMLEPAAIAALLTAARAKVLVTLAPFPGTDLYDKAVEVASAVPTLRHVVLVEMTPHVRGPRRLAARFLAARARMRAAPMPGRTRVRSFSRDLVRMPGGALLSGRAIAASDTASYFCTGGTTGLPKIAMRTHGQEVANAWMTVRTLSGTIDEGSTLFCGLPMFHVNAVIATGLAVFLDGARVLLGGPQGYRTPGLVAAFWDVLSHHRVAAFSGVPTLLGSLLDQPPTSGDLSALRCAFSGAAPLSAELLRRFEDRCRVPVVEAYGLTETACVASMNPLAGERRCGSVGLPLPLQDIRTVVVDPAGAFVREAARDEIGVVTIAGPNVFSGYLTRGHDAGLWVERGDGRRWLNTGDLGRIDADGYLWLTGRAKDLIIRGGHNIDPSVIEEALHTHPAVLLAAAVGRPDAHAGEVPAAYVQLRPGMVIEQEALIAHVAARVGERAAIPKAITIIEAMPLTAIGKIHKPTLRLAEIAIVAHSVLMKAGIRAQVDAVTDDRRGSVARIVADPTHADAIRIALAPFAFAHDHIASEFTT